jgi:hypothetical protein
MTCRSISAKVVASTRCDGPNARLVPAETKDPTEELDRTPAQSLWRLTNWRSKSKKGNSRLKSVPNIGPWSVQVFGEIDISPNRPAAYTPESYGARSIGQRPHRETHTMASAIGPGMPARSNSSKAQDAASACARISSRAIVARSFSRFELTIPTITP